MNILIEDGLIGDSILQEPAITARAIRDGHPIVVYVKNIHIRELFNNNPFIFLTSCPPVNDDWIRLSASDAFSWANQHNSYFGAGYFPQLGMVPRRDERVHFLTHWIDSSALYRDPDKPLLPFSYILLAPFGRSCSSPLTGEGNKTQTVAWWEELVRRLSEFTGPTAIPLLSLGSRTDPMIEGTVNVRGESLTSVAGLLNYSRLLISIETGILHMASHLCRDVIYLNSATPHWFCGPMVPRCSVYRKDRPKNWAIDEVLQSVKRNFT